MKRNKKCGRESRTVCQETNKMFWSVLEVAGYTKIHIKCPEYYSIGHPLVLEVLDIATFAVEVE